MESREGNLSRLGSLDMLRGIAILLVILLHTAISFPSRFGHARPLTVIENQGVQLFFLVSAYTMGVMWHARHAETHRSIKFYIRRLCRIAPLYWVAIVAYGLLRGFRPVDDTILNVLLLHSVSPTAINSVVPGGWSIGVEIFFYWFFPLFARLNPKYYVAYGWAFYLLVGVGVETLLQRAGANSDFLYYSPFTQFPVFLVGMQVYALNSGLVTSWRGPALTMVGWIASALVLRHFGFEARPIFWAGIAFMAVAMWAVIRWSISVGALRLFGRFSYSMYLAHFAMIQVLLALVSPGFPYLIAFALVLLATTLFAWLSFHTAERWSQRAGSLLARQVDVLWRPR
jgi:exopolysaccharide production protein ExoZ